MKLAPALLILLAASPVTGGQASAASIDGIWGVARGDGADCTGVHVIVLRDGRYTKALLDLGTTQGPRDVVVGTARFSFDGVRLEVAPSMSLDRPEQRQRFLWDPVSGTLRREEPAPSLVYRRCPDRPLRPLAQ